MDAAASGGQLIDLLRHGKNGNRLGLYTAFVAYKLEPHVLEAALSPHPVQTLLERARGGLLEGTDDAAPRTSGWYAMIAKAAKYRRTSTGKLLGGCPYEEHARISYI